MKYLPLIISFILNNRNIIFEFFLTFIAVFLGVFLEQKYELYRRKKTFLNQLSVLKEEVNLNIKTITDIKEGLETGFTLDRLGQEAIRTVLLNPDLFIFCRFNGGGH